MAEVVFHSSDGEPRRRQWHNAIPPAIVATEAYQSLTPSQRHTLQVMADKCTPEPDGSLVGCWGGQPLADAIGVSRRTLWRHVRALERLGLVVMTSRGGQVGRRNYSSVYAIPHALGALDARRVDRERRRMAPCSDGVRRPEVLQKNEQPMLWRRGEILTRPPQGGSDKMSQGVCQNVTPPSPLEGWSNGVPRANEPPSSRQRRTLGSVELADLTSTERLLALYDRATQRGVTNGSQAALEQFVAAAEHALRCAKTNPAGMFASLIRGAKYDFPNIDYDAAVKRLKRYRFRGDERRDERRDEISEVWE